MKKVICWTVLFCVLSMGMSASGVFAATLLINQQNPHLNYGYGLYLWDNMTEELNNAFDSSNITLYTGTLTDLDYMLGFDSFWITPKLPGSTLTDEEISTITAYINTGRRVVLIGENDSWTAWNNSILGTVGGSFDQDAEDTTLTVSYDHELTDGIASITMGLDGLATGGISLFDQNVATLWGSHLNVLSLLSVNIIDDYHSDLNVYNRKFQSNIAQWLAGGGNGSEVPEPTTLLLMSLGLIGLFGARRMICK